MSKIRTLCLATLCFAAAHCDVSAAAPDLQSKACPVKKSRITTNHLYAYNSNSSTLTVTAGSFIPFNTVPSVSAGCTISETIPNTFVLQPGDYLVTLVWDTGAGSATTVQLMVNGTLVSPAIGWDTDTLSQIVRITAKDSTLQVQNSGANTLSLAAPTGATIVITQLS